MFFSNLFTWSSKDIQYCIWLKASVYRNSLGTIYVYFPLFGNMFPQQLIGTGIWTWHSVNWHKDASVSVCFINIERREGKGKKLEWNNELKGLHLIWLLVHWLFEEVVKSVRITQKFASYSIRTHRNVCSILCLWSIISGAYDVLSDHVRN